MNSANITIAINKNQLMISLRSMTIDDDDFNPAQWSLWDAEVMEMAAALIRREIVEANRDKDLASTS